MDSIEKLSTAITLIEEARGVPLSASCVVHRGEILEILDGARIALPQDLSAAEAILVQRDNLVEEGRASAEQMIATAREDVARITQLLTTEIELLIRRAPEQWHLFQPNWPSDPGYQGMNTSFTV